MPAFGTIAVRDMLEEMRDISDQLLLKWERCVITIETLKVERRIRVAGGHVSSSGQLYRDVSFCKHLVL